MDLAASVDRSWAVITGVLRERWPAGLGHIRAPAAPADLRAVEAAMGVPLPPDLVRWWQLADGAEHRELPIVPRYATPCSVEAALATREVRIDIAAEFAEDRANVLPPGPAGTEHYEWLPQWLPVAGVDGDETFVDLRPGPDHGCVGWYSNDGFHHGMHWPNIAAMLADIAAAMGEDRPFRSPYNLMDGWLIWLDADGLAWDRESDRWVQARTWPVPAQWLTRAYTDLLAHLRAGRFSHPPTGSWPAGHVAAHVLRTTELLAAAAVELASIGTATWQRHPITVRYDNSDAMNPNTLDRYAASGLTALADKIDQAATRLATATAGLPTELRLHAHIIDNASHPVVNTTVGWWDILWALCTRQLPIHGRQLAALRSP